MLGCSELKLLWRGLLGIAKEPFRHCVVYEDSGFWGVFFFSSLPPAALGFWKVLAGGGFFVLQVEEDVGGYLKFEVSDVCVGNCYSG
jgi:hypothetical protein